MSGGDSPDRRPVHCWADRRACIEELFGFGSQAWINTWLDGWKSGTCMLEHGHGGPHEFTDDDEIGVTFVGERCPSSPAKEDK